MVLDTRRGNAAAALEKEELRRQWEVEDLGWRNGPYAHETSRVDDYIYRQREQQLREIDLQHATLFNNNYSY